MHTIASGTASRSATNAASESGASDADSVTFCIVAVT
jgi:hypothetical protein